MLLPLEEGGRLVKLLDFGLVKAVDSKRLGGLTTSGSLTGTPLYMSPEQIVNERVDERSQTRCGHVAAPPITGAAKRSKRLLPSRSSSAVIVR